MRLFNFNKIYYYYYLLIALLFKGLIKKILRQTISDKIST